MNHFYLSKITRMVVLCFALIQFSCSSDNDGNTANISNPEPENPAATADVTFWLTKSDESVKLKKQSDIISFKTETNTFPSITVDESQTFQTIDGFGYTLTGGSADVINALDASKKTALLEELFGDSDASISVSYLRISVGASDLNAAPFTYNDLPEGEADTDLSEFSLEKDSGVISLLQEILAINPDLKIMASPWTAPVWMKDNNSFIGGSLRREYYQVYADYWLKYLQEMQAAGITIDALTPQNEPLHGGNNPSMYMEATDQTDFIKNNLGPTLREAGFETKIIAYDHNCDNPNYPITVMSDEKANPFVDGAAFHLYAGDIRALSTVHNAFPDKNVYFTEQYNSSEDDFGGTLRYHVNNVIIGSMRNWSKNALEWNLANDADFGPHTDGGCTICKGALTISGGETVNRNVGYYIVAHASKFIPAGSVRIASNVAGSLQNAAFITPNGKKVLLVENDGNSQTTFNIQVGDEFAITTLDAGAVGTYIWE
ncbi:glycoside hydrolase family 30 protein [Flavimarina sp. Hel_I_48]|uniref:glycoside hydrolase family 30 protein n=1 Tax=Flavimarina sp. Hel_I_48 TaxID=1392488 RepID=UPI0004DFA05A|nr:glycoside hydrolase family 30 beta sandwich domain-containing protein [Flavimarina sp. Hel_I_48]